MVAPDVDELAVGEVDEVQDGVGDRCEQGDSFGQWADDRRNGGARWEADPRTNSSASSGDEMLPNISTDVSGPSRLMTRTRSNGLGWPP